MYKEKYVYAMVHPGVNHGYMDVYLADKKIKMSDLRKDYFQQIQVMPHEGSEYNVTCVTCANGPDKLGNGTYTVMFEDESGVIPVIGELSTEEATSLNVSNYVDVYIVFPDWETKNLKIYRNKDLKCEFSSSNKECSRYIPAFVYDVQTDKVTMSKNNVVTSKIY